MRKRLLALVMVSMFAFSILPVNVMPQEGPTDPAFTFDQYHDYAKIKAELERISSEFSDITSFTVLGQTWEGRDIMALRLTDNPDDDEPGEPGVLIMGGHHGNELASVEVPMYILGFLTENYAYNATVRELVDSRDIWFVPLVNPDGREYSMAGGDQTWRKNRRPIDVDGDGTPEGMGVDLNRNYGHLWGEEPGTSHDPMASNYCGPDAFSENETAAVRDLALSRNFAISLSYHTFGEVIYYPWNNNIDTASPEAKMLEAIAGKMGAMTGYTPMQGIDAYPTTGDSDDWLYADTNCLPFTVELGTQYVTPPEQLPGLLGRNLDAALYAIDIAGEPRGALLPEWTFMVYMSADLAEGDPLGPQAMKDLNHMETVGSADDLNIVALYDGSTPGDSGIYHVLKDPGGYNSAIISPIIDDGGAVIDPATKELDMSDPSVLRNFVNWTLDNYPARKNLLVFWGHGDGVLRTFVPDYSSGSGLRITDLADALGSFKLDIVGFDTCSLGHFEVASELVGIADIMIGSEAEEPLAGWDYAASLGKLAEKTFMAPRELATAIVSDYLESNPEGYLTQAALDLAVFRDRLMPALEEFVAVSLDFAYADHGKIWSARNATDTFLSRQDAVDLFEFLGNLRESGASSPVENRMDVILDMDDDLIIHSGTGSLYPDAGSMAVYFPLLEAPVSPAYSGLKFLETGWGDYLAGTKSPVPRPIMSSVEPGAADNTMGPYNVSAAISGPGAGPFTLFYRPVSGSWESVPMAIVGQSLHGEIPGHPNGTVIEYYILHGGSNITEPYEVKWGSQDYFNFTVIAVCDVSLAWVRTPDSPQQAGNVSHFSLNCSNAGPEPTRVNVSLVLTGPAEVLVGWKVLELGVGEYGVVGFNWTAEPGAWLVTASVGESSVYDPNPENPETTMWLNVTGTANQGGFLAEHGMMLAVLALLWCVSLVLMLHMLRKSRRRRREAVERSIAAANEFLETAREFGGDTTEAGVALARARAALDNGDLPGCEELILEARESAMNAVGERQSPP